MTFENKVFVGGLGVLFVCFGLIWLELATNNTVLLAIFPWVLWLSFHNRLTKTFAIASLLGLLGAVALGVPLGLLLFVASMVAFWYAWI